MSAISSVATTTVKLTVALPKKAVDAISEIAAAQKKTKTQVLREAIALKVYIERELAVPGTRLLIQRGDETREVVFTDAL
jgi:hypothetical protein